MLTLTLKDGKVAGTVQVGIRNAAMTAAREQQLKTQSIADDVIARVTPMLTADEVAKLPLIDTAALVDLADLADEELKDKVLALLEKVAPVTDDATAQERQRLAALEAAARMNQVDYASFEFSPNLIRDIVGLHSLGELTAIDLINVLEDGIQTLDGSGVEIVESDVCLITVGADRYPVLNFTVVAGDSSFSFGLTASLILVGNKQVDVVRLLASIYYVPESTMQHDVDMYVIQEGLKSMAMQLENIDQMPPVGSVTWVHSKA